MRTKVEEFNEEHKFTIINSRSRIDQDSFDDTFEISISTIVSNFDDEFELAKSRHLT